MSNDQDLARNLGLMSLGLGVVQLTAPRWFSNAVGVQPRESRPMIVRLIGLRELVTAAGLLGSRNKTVFLWARVAGDVMDMALLGRAMTARDARPDRVGGALAGAVGVTVLDVAASLSSDDGAAERRETGATGGGAKPVRAAVTVNRPRNEVYDSWRDLQSLPRFMRHLVDVREMDGNRSHWTAKAPGGATVEWDAEIVDDRPNELLAWRSVEGSQVHHAGSVRFRDAPGGRGTEVIVEMAYDPPGGPIGVVVAKLFGQEPEQQTHDDLRRFKQVMEVGDVVVSEAVLGDRRMRQRPAQPIGVAS
jgi:uncharacterized membrane protein